MDADCARTQTHLRLRTSPSTASGPDSRLSRTACDTALPRAALNFQDHAQFPTGIQATGTPTAAAMTYATSPGVGLRVTGVTQAGYTARAQHRAAEVGVHDDHLLRGRFRRGHGSDR